MPLPQKPRTAGSRVMAATSTVRTPVTVTAAVLGLSFLLLLMVFRSVLVPIKAVVMNLLSIAAALPLLPDAGEQEHLVVHRQAEQHREQEDRDPAVDLR